jgi:hypothetical protein
MARAPSDSCPSGALAVSAQLQGMLHQTLVVPVQTPIWSDVIHAPRPPAEPPLVATCAQALGFEWTVVQVPRQHQATASKPDTYYLGTAFPVGSLLDLLVHDSPSSSVSNSLLVDDGRDAMDDRSRSLQYEHLNEASPFSSITRMLACSQVLGFCQDSMSYARIA